MKLKQVFLCLFLFGYFSCSTPIDVFNGDPVTLNVNEKSLLITNGTSERIYIYAVEEVYSQTTLSLWAPHFGEPSIAPGETLELSFVEIENGKPEPVQRDEVVVVNWWTGNTRDYAGIEIKSIATIL